MFPLNSPAIEGVQADPRPALVETPEFDRRLDRNF